MRLTTSSRPGRRESEIWEGRAQGSTCPVSSPGQSDMRSLGKHAGQKGGGSCEDLGKEQGMERAMERKKEKES